MTTETSLPGKQRRSRRLVPLATLIVVGLLIIGGVFLIPRVPDAPDPFDVEAFRRATLPPEQNAFEFYRQATAKLRPLAADQQAAYDAVLESGWAGATPELQQWLEQNGEALALYREGSARPDALADPPGTPAAGITPATQELRALARLARLEGTRLEHEGNRSGAADLYLVSLRSSRHAGRRGAAVHRLTGAARHAPAAAARVRWAAAPEVDAALLRAVFADVGEIDRQTVPLSLPLQGEYVGAQLSLDALPATAFLQKRTTRPCLRLGFEN